MSFLLRTSPILLATLVPYVAFAQEPENFADIVGILLSILGAFVPLVFGLALIAILWAGAQMILHADNSQKREDGRRTLFWGIIVLFIMLSMWGLVNLLRDSVFL